MKKQKYIIFTKNVCLEITLKKRIDKEESVDIVSANNAKKSKKEDKEAYLRVLFKPIFRLLIRLSRQHGLVKRSKLLIK